MYFVVTPCNFLLWIMFVHLRNSMKSETTRSKAFLCDWNCMVNYSSQSKSGDSVHKLNCCCCQCGDIFTSLFVQMLIQANNKETTPCFSGPLCWKPLVTGGFSTQMVSNMENGYKSWCHHQKSTLPTPVTKSLCNSKSLITQCVLHSFSLLLRDQHSSILSSAILDPSCYTIKVWYHPISGTFLSM